jgi:hypothetical protein
MKPLTLLRVVITDVIENEDLTWTMRFIIEDKNGKKIGGGERIVDKIKDLENEQYELYKEIKEIIYEKDKRD